MGFKDTLVKIFSNKKARNKVVKTATKRVSQVLPIAKIVQAGHGVYNLGNTANNVNDFVSKASGVADTAQKFVPQMQVMGQSVCDSLKIFGYFNMAATTLGNGADLVLTYQGTQVLHLIAAKLDDISTSLAAGTALKAQQEFPEYVYMMIQEQLTQTANDTTCDHWFFVFHPDNDWYPKFFHLLEERRLDPRFCGYTNQIDTAFLFMLAARRRIYERARKDKHKGRQSRPVKLHLLVLAYQPILICEALRIPEEIGDFVIEGRIHGNREFVWLNLPEEQRRYVSDIGNWVPPSQGRWDWGMSLLGLADKPPELGERRTLGTKQQPSESGGEGNSGDESDRDSISSREARASDDLPGLGEIYEYFAAPLHHRHRQGRRRRRRRSHREDRGRSRGSESTFRNSHQGRHSRRPSRAERREDRGRSRGSESTFRNSHQGNSHEGRRSRRSSWAER